MVRRFASAESRFNTDDDQAYTAFAKLDTRWLFTGQKVRCLLCVAMGVELSLWWRGDRQVLKIWVDGEQPAKGRGRAKGAEPKMPC